MTGAAAVSKAISHVKQPQKTQKKLIYLALSSTYGTESAEWNQIFLALCAVVLYSGPAVNTQVHLGKP
jgi:hypothetical protein